MARRKLTWFGFGLNQKQAVWIFVIAIIGICILSFVLLMFFYSIISMFIYYDPYYMPSNYFSRMLLSILPILIFILVLLIIAIYTAVKCRQIAVYYSKDLYSRKSTPQVEKVPPIKARNTPIKLTPIFCPNCGQKLSKGTRFCTNCGADLTYL